MLISADIACRQLPKEGEELCGDAVEIVRDRQGVTVILSDGLGSGVKASILATLTVKVAAGLLRRRVDLHTVLESVADTLPVCQTRGLAYSTLSILRLEETGQASLVEIGNPGLLLFRGGRPVPVERRTSCIMGKEVAEAKFAVEPGDCLLLVSDGVIHAGVEALFDLGLGPEGLIEHLPDPCQPARTAIELARIIIELAEACSCGAPRDDATAVAVKIRAPSRVTVCTGPPVRPADDRRLIQRLLADVASQKVVCGGTTGQIVARETGHELTVEPEYADPAIPPTAEIEGVALATEGILTLNRCLTILSRPEPEITGADGASRLARILLEADEVTFLVGLAQNPAHRDLETLVHLLPRDKSVDRLQSILEEMGKRVMVEFF
ncbi:MAG: PP2C family protein-serine/threonine phosphatase [Bacillota bacterium]